MLLAAQISISTPIPLESNWFFLIVEYLATFFCGIIGGLAACRKDLDAFSIMIAAWFTALGGGTIRDVLIGCIPPSNLTNYWYLGVAVLAGLCVIFLHPEVKKLYWTNTIFDALSLALFTIDGTTKGLAYHMPAITAIFVGVITGVGGGVCRDIILNEVPVIIRDKHLYLAPAIVAAIFTVLVCKAYIFNWINFTCEILLDILIMLITVTLRLLSVKLDWTMPGAVKRNQPLSLHSPKRVEKRGKRRPSRGLLHHK
ncbi:MAG: TRIC cation channel family protein [Aeriscardovia sp.]|nr:TRIC cation channel family protein [Aeriscardovia sp.]